MLCKHRYTSSQSQVIFNEPMTTVQAFNNKRKLDRSQWQTVNRKTFLWPVHLNQWPSAPKSFCGLNTGNVCVIYSVFLKLSHSQYFYGHCWPTLTFEPMTSKSLMSCGPTNDW